MLRPSVALPESSALMSDSWLKSRENTFIKARQKIANALRMTSGDVTGKSP